METSSLGLSKNSGSPSSWSRSARFGIKKGQGQDFMKKFALDLFKNAPKLHLMETWLIERRNLGTWNWCWKSG